MMMLFHMALSLDLVALVMGVALYTWSIQNQVAGTSLAKVIGLIVTVMSIIGVLCTSYYGFKAWQEEMYFKNMMRMQNMQAGPAMDMNMQGVSGAAAPMAATVPAAKTTTTKRPAKNHSQKH